MNWGMYLITVLAVTGLFTAGVLGTQSRNPVMWVDDYPPDIKEAYYRHVGQPAQAKRIQASTILRKLIACVICVAIFAFVLVKIGAVGFWSGFGLSLGCWIWIAVYDTCFLDFVVFANWKRLRLPGTQHMDKAYHQKMFHVIAALKYGLMIALVISLLTGLGVWVING